MQYSNKLANKLCKINFDNNMLRPPLKDIVIKMKTEKVYRNQSITPVNRTLVLNKNKGFKLKQKKSAKNKEDNSKSSSEESSNSPKSENNFL